MGYAHRACCCNEGPGPPETCDGCIEITVSGTFNAVYEIAYSSGVTQSYTMSGVTVDLAPYAGDTCQFAHSGSGAGTFDWITDSPATGCPTDDSCPFSAWTVPSHSPLIALVCELTSLAPEDVAPYITTPTFWVASMEPMGPTDGVLAGCDCSPFILAGSLYSVSVYYDRTVADPRDEDWSTVRAIGIAWFDGGSSGVEYFSGSTGTIVLGSGTTVEASGGVSSVT